MKTRFFRGALALVSLAATVLAGPRDAQWKQVDQATNQGLPKTAIEQLEPIISGALADKSYAEAIKAIARKIALEGNIQGNKAEEKIVRLQAELEKAPAAMKPVMEAILAHWYWQYFQQNRWRFMQRTQMASAPGPDIQTWDLSRILTEIDKHFTGALANEETLKATPVSDYNELLEGGNAPTDYRPTMFDFLAYEALHFYQTGEQAAVVDEDVFEVEATSPIFDDATIFTNWQPEVTANDSPKLKAIRLYQALLTFHQHDRNRSAFYDTDLARITYGKNIAVGEGTIDRYKTALQRFVDATSKHETSARALAALAAQLNTENEPAKAHELAQRGLDAFPSSVGASLCYNLIQEIEAKSAQLNTEGVWNAPWPTLNVTYRNVTKIYFRAVAFDFVDEVNRNVDAKDLLKRKPVLAWTADVPPTKDFKQRTEKLPAPTSLKPGFYIIVASHDHAFSETDNQLSISPVWVSDLALVLRTRDSSTKQSGLVLQANSGEPVSGATVHFWKGEMNGALKSITPTETDENGRFEFSSENRSLLILAEHDGQAIATPHAIYSYGRDRTDSAASQTVFFTDRALYRPGQTINYKGVSIRYDREGGKYTVLSGKKITVVFNDPNGKEIARAEHKTNDYGSFDGLFTAPRDRLMGRMTIQVLGRPSSTSINVEEYKRPKFQVELNAPVEATKLDAPVVLPGKATAYNGSAIGGAKVKWRVERHVQLPYWCWWWQPPAVKAIAHGVAVTEPDGTFKIQFPAEPDRAVPAKNEPTFTFSLHADVTDTTGETRSAERAVHAGYTALQAMLQADEWQTPDKPVELSIATNSLDGDPQPANGTVTIYTLKQPSAVERSPLQREHYWWNMNNDEPKIDPTNPDSSGTRRHSR